MHYLNAAYSRAKEILDSGDFTHYASGSGEIEAEKAVWTVGYRYSEIGENLAKGYDDPNKVIEGWMNSSTHKENILNSNYQEIGIAVVEGIFQKNWDNIIVLLLGET